MKSKYTRPKIDPLMLLALLVTLGVVMTSTVSAAEKFPGKTNVSILEDGEITLARAEHGRAGIHMSFMSPSGLNGDKQSSHLLASELLSMPDVYFSVRLPW